MRQINDSYHLIASSLGHKVDSELTARPQSAAAWRSPGGDAEASSHSDLLDSFSVRLPGMSWNRWLSLGAFAANLLVATTILPRGAGDPAYDWGMKRAVGAVFAYFFLPLYLIWGGGMKQREVRLLFQAIGWVLMTIPAIVEITWRPWP
jgi:hypothetical protein